MDKYKTTFLDTICTMFLMSKVNIDLKCKNSYHCYVNIFIACLLPILVSASYCLVNNDRSP